MKVSILSLQAAQTAAPVLNILSTGDKGTSKYKIHRLMSACFFALESVKRARSKNPETFLACVKVTWKVCAYTVFPNI